MFQEDDSIWLDVENEHMVVTTKDGWRLWIPFSMGLNEVNERLARFTAMFSGHQPAITDLAELPLCILVTRRHGILATPGLVRPKLGHRN